MSVPVRQSLVSQCVQILRDGICHGEWTAQLPGELPLCRRLKVSRVTLRTALAQLESEGLLRVSKGRRRELVTPGKKQAARHATLSRVIMLSPVAWGGLTASKLLWIDELRDRLAHRGVPMEFVVSTAAAMQRPARVLKTLTSQHPHAVWLLLRSTAQMQQFFASEKLPTVVAGSLFDGSALPCVDSDYFAACRHAAGRLLGRGCRRLGLLMPQVMLAGDQESEAGFREGAGAHPVEVARHDGTPDGLCRSLDSLMRSHPPDGLLVCQPTHAVTALGRLLTTGWQVPRDVKLISRDDDPFLEHVTPLPARYSVRPGAFASRLARAIGLWLDGQTPAPRAEQLLPEFISGTTL